MPDNAASETAGAPRFREEERVRLIIAGDMFNQPVHPVDEAIKERFSAAYKAFKDSKVERHVEGTLLREWPQLSRIQIAELEALGIYSVESLRDISDSNVNRIPDGRIWREKAKAWLDQAKDGAAATRYAAENERLREKLEALEKRLAEVESAEPRRGPGRPRKDEMAA